MKLYDLIKPLEWKKVSDSSYYFKSVNCPFATYEIFKNLDNFYLSSFELNLSKSFNSFEEALEAANKDYKDKIISCFLNQGAE